MGGSKHIGNASTWVAVCSAPDYCQVGNSVVPFDSFAIVNKSTVASPDVIAQGVPVYRVGDMHQGVQADAGAGIPSGTSLGGGCVKFLQGENDIRANGLPVVRHDSACLVNCNGAGIGGALGRLFTEVLVSWAKSEAPNDALRALLEDEWDERAWYERAWDGIKGAAKGIDSAVRFVPSTWERVADRASKAVLDEPSGTLLDVLIGAGKGLGNLPSDCYNLANYVSKNISFGHAIQQRQLEKAAITAFQNGDTASANRFANEAAEMTTSGYVEDIFTLENEAQRRGSFLSMLVPVGTIVKALGTAAKVFRGAKTLDTAADAAKLATASPAMDGVYVTPKRVISGARELSRFDWTGAERAYELIRSSDSDVAAIAKNTGISEARVARIKDHVFNRTHQLDDGVRRFDADPEIANAWRRMENGSHTSKDIDLMNHELFESKFEGIHKTDYRTAHDAANRSGRKSGLE